MRVDVNSDIVENHHDRLEDNFIADREASDQFGEDEVSFLLVLEVLLGNKFGSVEPVQGFSCHGDVLRAHIGQEASDDDVSAVLVVAVSHVHASVGEKIDPRRFELRILLVAHLSEKLEAVGPLVPHEVYLSDGRESKADGFYLLSKVRVSDGVDETLFEFFAEIGTDFLPNSL